MNPLKKEESVAFYWHGDQKIPLFPTGKVAVIPAVKKEKTMLSVLQGMEKEYTVLRRGIILLDNDIASNLKVAENAAEVLPVLTSDGNNLLVITQEILLQFRKELPPADQKSFLNKYGLKKEGRQRNLYVCASAEQALNLANELHTLPEVQYAEPNFVQVFRPHFVPDDALFSDQWPLRNTGQGGGTSGIDIGAVAAWDVTRGSDDVIIAILDEGVDYDHEDLDVGDKLVTGYDALTGTDDPRPENNDAHGTACAGIAAAAGDNAMGVSGVAPGCKIMGVRIARGIVVDGIAMWETSNAEISDAIDTAVARGAHVLSNSWGGGAASNAITQSIQDARDNGRGGLGCVIVFAAGNDNGAVSYPGTLNTVYTVAAHNEFNERKSPDSQDGEDWWGSNFGPEIDISAPGVHVTTTDISGNRGYTNNNYLNHFNGTSAATPHVAGVAGLILSLRPELTVAEVEDILSSTAIDMGAAGFDNFTGNGRLNARGAVELAFSTITPRTTELNYIDVPEDEERGQAIRFDVNSMTGRSFEITTPLSAPFRIVNSTGGVPDTTVFDEEREVYLWITYTGTNAGDTIPPPPTSVTVICNETQESWVIPISANTIARPTTAIMLCLDQSASMDWASGIGSSKRIDVLRYSASILMDVVQAGNGVGIVSFDHDPHDIKLPVVGPLGPPTDNVFDPQQVLRQDLKNAIGAFNPNLAGNTAIGDGLERAQLRLNATGGYDNKAVIVLTDGEETADKYIRDVRDQINDKVFAVGLGRAENINPAALDDLTNNTGGYMLLTDNLDTDSTFKLAKYFLQILAGVTNENIVVDPTGRINQNQEVRIPFVLNDSDISADIILMLPFKDVIEMYLETPDGNRITRADHDVITGVKFQASNNVTFYRLSLPVATGGGEKEGTWHAVLKVNKDYFKKYLGSLKNKGEDVIVSTHGVLYTLLVHTYSNLNMKARVQQNSYEPGARATLKALLSECGIPLNSQASVKGYLKAPDGTSQILNFTRTAAGEYTLEYDTYTAGIYEFVIKAKGYSSRGNKFTREQVLTVSVWKGGDQPPRNPIEPGENQGADLCGLVSCLLGSMDKELRARLVKEGLNVDTFEKCMAAKCKPERPLKTLK